MSIWRCDRGLGLKERAGSEEGGAGPCVSSCWAQNHLGWRISQPPRTSQDLLHSFSILLGLLLLSWLRLFSQPINMLKPFLVTQHLLQAVSKFSSLVPRTSVVENFLKCSIGFFASYSFPLPGCVLACPGDFGCFLKSGALRGV